MYIYIQLRYCYIPVGYEYIYANALGLMQSCTKPSIHSLSYMAPFHSLNQITWCLIVLRSTSGTRARKRGSEIRSSFTNDHYHVLDAALGTQKAIKRRYRLRSSDNDNDVNLVLCYTGISSLLHCLGGLTRLFIVDIDVPGTLGFASLNTLMHNHIISNENGPKQR